MNSIPNNPLVLFQNHFSGHRRQYPLVTQLAIAADLGYDGFELHCGFFPPETPDWDVVGTLAARFRIKISGLYCVLDCVVDEKAAQFDQALAVARQYITRLARLDPPGYFLYGVLGDPGPADRPGWWENIAVHGSAHAEPRHWQRAGQLVAAIDRLGRDAGVPCILYTHGGFFSDTPAACLHMIQDAQTVNTTLSLVSWHWYTNKLNPEMKQVVDLIGKQRLGYVALQQVMTIHGQLRGQTYDQGPVDMAQMLAHVWWIGYDGPLICQGFDIGGDPYLTAQKARDHVRAIAERFRRNPDLNPAQA